MTPIKRLLLTSAALFFSFAAHAQDIGGGLNNPGGGSGSSGIVVGTTTVSGGTNNDVLYVNNGYVGVTAAGTGSVTSVTFTGDGTIFSSTPSSAVTTSGTVTATLKNQTANTILGALTATTPSDLAVPSCSTSASALSWTSGTGFGCNTAIAAPAASITGTTLASNVVTTSITTVGTLGSLAVTGAVTDGSEVIGSATGGNQGAGTINATGIAVNGAAVSSTASGYLNRFRNAQMVVVSRGTSGTVTTSPDLYTADGWEVHTTGASVTWSQTGSVTIPANGQHTSASLTITGANSNTDAKLYQKIESYDAAVLAGQQVTVQFTYTNTTGASNTPTIASCYASAKDNFATCTSDLSATNLQACTSTSTCTEAYSFTPSANAVNGYEITFDFGALSTTGKNVLVSAADVRVTTGTATGLIAAPVAPELINVAADFAKNGRFVQSSYGNGVAPGTASTNATAYLMYAGPTTNSSCYQMLTVPFTVPMRSVPACTVYSSNSGTASKIYTSNANADVAGRISSVSANAVMPGMVNAIFDANDQADMHVFCSSEL